MEGDLSDFNSVSTALKGVSSAYSVYPIQVPGLIEATAFFIVLSALHAFNLRISARI